MPLVERSDGWALINPTADELAVVRECASNGTPLTRSALVLGLRRIERAKRSRGIRRIRRRVADGGPEGS
jgi:hypothetical protein